MNRTISLKLIQNTQSGEIHFYRVKSVNGKLWDAPLSICKHHNKTDGHSRDWLAQLTTNKRILTDILPALARQNREHELCDWCVGKLLSE